MQAEFHPTTATGYRENNLEQAHSCTQEKLAGASEAAQFALSLDTAAIYTTAMTSPELPPRPAINHQDSDTVPLFIIQQRQLLRSNIKSTSPAAAHKAKHKNKDRQG